MRTIDLRIVRDDVACLALPLNFNAFIGQTLYFGSNYQRLESIKQTYDPRKVFTFPQSIGSQ